MTYDIQLVHKEEIKIGDAILCKDDRVRTVCRKDISNGFMGLCIFGDSYRSDMKKLKR